MVQSHRELSMCKMVDTQTKYITQGVSTWEERLLKRIKQICNKCNYARFILTVDNGRITLEQIGKPETIKTE